MTPSDQEKWFNVALMGVSVQNGISREQSCLDSWFPSPNQGWGFATRAANVHHFPTKDHCPQGWGQW